CPTERLNISKKFLKLIDANGDSRIRAPEILTAVDWTLARLTAPDCLFNQRPLTLDDIKPTDENHNVISAAKRLLTLLGREQTSTLSEADTQDLNVIFPADQPNGDGLIPAQLTADFELQTVIQSIIKILGADKDRSGEDAVSAEKINDYFEQFAAVKVWHESIGDETKLPFAEQTSNVITLLNKLRNKIDDYFTRQSLIAYDARAAEIMAGEEDELVRLSTSDLSQLEGLRNLPLANLQQEHGISFEQGLNPAWQADMMALYETAIKPKWGEIDRLTAKHWQELIEQAQPYFAWHNKKPAVAILEHFSVDEILATDSQQQQAQLLALVAEDLEVAEAAEGWVNLDKLLNMQQYLVPFLRNFVSFEDFYGRKQSAIFQAGQLFIDGKSCDLVVEVNDVNTHSAIAAKSNSFLIYCACKRRGQPVDGREECQIVALVSAGTDHELMVGRNGLFYDSQGNDWDATIVKVVENSISVREAFWSPYRRVATMISEQIQKLASNQNNQTMANVSDKVTTKNKAEKDFDIARFAGIFAAFGLAIGALGTALAAAFSGLFLLQWWQWPLVVLGLLILIS
ncbi:MAG TPA: hypothetical protein VL020_06920, partial [Pseudomonadales bacterium]|nr:hypothetical protein [Pseudomonadales bacterium]